MSVLRDPGRIRACDPGGMHRHIERLPEQIEAAHRIAREAAVRVSGEGVTAVAVLGMGGSAIGGELAFAYLADRLAVPCQVVRDYTIPAFVGRGTLALVSSYSGNTEETLSAYRAATARGARVVCSTTGGELARLAEENGHDVFRIPPGLPPRAAIGYGVVPLLVLLSRLGLAADPGAEIESAAGEVRARVGEYGLASPPGANPAKDLAGWFEGRIPVVYGAAPRTSVVASRWCGQFSENAKLVAHRHELPEMNHNEIVGWSGARPFDGRARVVLLRDEEDHPRVAKRFEITREAIAAAGAEVRDVASSGAGRLARLFSLVVLGDFVSVYLAALAGVDPTPVAPIDKLKKALAST
jgi:glucose/mannose-6-phosphate isomerase